MITFWILWIFNALMAMVPVYFFFEGISDGTIDGNNLWMWVIILMVVGLILWGTYWLKSKNQLLAAKILLILAAIPSLMVILFMVFAISSDVRWN